MRLSVRRRPSQEGRVGLGSRRDGLGEFGEPIVLDSQVQVADLQVEAAVLAPVDAAVARFAEYLVLVVRESVISHGNGRQPETAG